MKTPLEQLNVLHNALSVVDWQWREGKEDWSPEMAQEFCSLAAHICRVHELAEKEYNQHRKFRELVGGVE